MGELKIKHFKKLKKNKPITCQHEYPMSIYTPVGCSLEEIDKLQISNKVEFPKAYVEFLYLAGKSHRLFDSGIDSEFEMLEKIQDCFSLELKESNIEINRSIWAIDMLNGEQFSFFYLDDKSENPIVYHYLNDWEDEPFVFNFNNVIFSTEKTISKYFDSMVPNKTVVFITKVIFGIIEFILKLLKKKNT